jgi:hypothetical protein
MLDQIRAWGPVGMARRFGAIAPPRPSVHKLRADFVDTAEFVDTAPKPGTAPVPKIIRELHSITSSARAISVGEMSRPSALAVLRLNAM